MIGQFMETYLHRPIETLQFLTPGRIEKWYNFKYFSHFDNTSPASRVVHMTNDFLTCHSCSYYSFMVAVQYDSSANLNTSWKLEKSLLPKGNLEFVNHHIVHKLPDFFLPTSYSKMWSRKLKKFLRGKLNPFYIVHQVITPFLTRVNSWQYYSWLFQWMSASSALLLLTNLLCSNFYCFAWKCFELWSIYTTFTRRCSNLQIIFWY